MCLSCVCYILHDDASYLAASIQSFQEAGKVFAFVSRVHWHDQPGDWQAAAQVAQDAGAEVVLGEWRSELEHRQFALACLREQGYTHALIPDGDEIIEPALLHALTRIAASELAERVYIHWDTYWKTPEYVIRPRERFTPCMLLDLRAAVPTGLRDFEGGRSLLLPPDYGLVHHLSYVGPDSRIRRKLATWGHKHEVRPGWWEHVWLHWDANKLLRDLHPTHPPAYHFAERITPPALLQSALLRYEELDREIGRGGEGEIGRQGDKEINTKSFLLPAFSLSPPLPISLSVVIPLHGGREDLRLCLDSLEACREMVSEVVVVDNASPDDALEEADGRDWVKVVRNEENRGFAAACNQGAAASTGEILLFLNSDVVVPAVGLARLLESLRVSGSIAAAGPYTNRAGHGQQIAPTYTSLDTLDLFARDFASREAADEDCDMLVGFCLAVRRSAFVEVGGFDERFGIGTFEDNDLCYRLRRAGYRLTRSGRSFVHHGGSQTFQRLNLDVSALLSRNERLYRQKWQADLDCGYASHLSGLSPQPVRFDPARHPAIRARQIAELARRADISLCMIVKDEERVLGECLQSARPFFREMIVVDTGSTDRTKAIAREHGAQVHDSPWTDSFSDARNESLKYAQGKWLFWMDADDTLPPASGEALLHAALHAPAHIAGFVVPVQFVDEGPSRDGASGAGGTRVDHVKLFRNLSGLRFEGRIHEQILASLRPHGDIARSSALVLHSGYDTSPEGQARKRIRDAKLLQLDLRERPGHPFVLFNLGMTDHYGGEHAGAIGWLRQSIEAANPGDSHVRKAYALLALSLRQMGQAEESRAVLEAGLQSTPADPELHFHLAHLLTEQAQYAEAEAHYARVLEGDIAGHFSSVDVGILGYKSLHNLGGLAVLQSDYRKAKAWFGQAMQAAPHFLPSAFALFDAALEASDHAEARDTLAWVLGREGTGGSWADMGLRYAESIGGEPNGWLFLEQAVARYPAAVAPRLLLARRLLQACRMEEALPHLRQLDAQNVAEAAYCLSIAAIRMDNYPAALVHAQRALCLNPAHEPTRQQVQFLQTALAQSEHDRNISPEEPQCP